MEYITKFSMFIYYNAKTFQYIDLTDNKRTRMEEDDATTGESNFDEDSIMDVDDNSQKLIDEIVDFINKSVIIITYPT